MPKRYKHIKLPGRLISRSEDYTPHKGWGGEKIPPVDHATWSKKIGTRLKSVSKYAFQKKDSAIFEEDKNKDEILLNFRGYLRKDFIQRYRIEIVERKSGTSIVGRISNKSLPNQNRSDYEQLLHDANIYQNTPKFRFKTFFGGIDDIKPLKLDKIIDLELKRYFKAHPRTKVLTDISFSEGGDLTERKISKLSETFGENMVSRINSSFVHFCRIQLNYQEIQNIALQYSGISHIEFASEIGLDFSELIHPTQGNLDVIRSENIGESIIMVDSPLNPNHMLLHGAISAHDGGTPHPHGTGVASLLVCGQRIDPRNQIIQENSVIAIHLDPDARQDTSFLKIEEKLKEVVEQYAQTNSLVLVNFSLNAPSRLLPYKRKPVHRLTKVIDELCWKYNCLFFISAGNLKNRGMEAARSAVLIAKGYPRYFESEHARILPPADSINAISVGSITQANGINSLAGMHHPSPGTRANLEKNAFVKPDLVHYDSNFILSGTNDISSEDNGPLMASERDNSTLRSTAGTSFATPLVAHAAGLLHSAYPEYSNNTIKALLIHSANNRLADQLTGKQKRYLLGHGLPEVEKALYSLSTSSILVIEDSISVDKRKKIRIPIPAGISGSRLKRLRIKMTLVYNPPINTADEDNYNPLEISARLLRGEVETPVSTHTTRNRLSDAFSKSNVKKYVEEFSTREHTGCFWNIEVECNSLIENFQQTLKQLPPAYSQKYSLIVGIEDITADENLDLHSEISQMIEIDVPVEIEV